MELKPNNYIVFLGDLVDRGPYSLEVLLFVFNLKVINPNNVYIINGNHEDYETYRFGGLGDEIDYQFTNDPNRLNKIKNTLYYLPSVIYLKFNNKWYHLSHGGMLDDYESIRIDDFLKSDAIYYYWDDNNYDNGYKWNDFDQFLYTYDIDRGWIFSPKETKNYLMKFNLESIISGHQDMNTLLLLINNPSSNIIYNDYRFELCRSHTHCDPYGKNYNLYGPIIDDKTKKNIIRLNPSTDFLALRTSTATISKLISMNVYLVLHK